ncbi:hypothetical protein GCM10011611_32930 [Aliidongia dinghuensis]|uniref:DUF983 domain-containing protein n=1 Tax=Aliidongia dinghuensis TaxID=1867774 RepID=A0A8J2YUL8_9PROT|nr:DUF983 domain-containing protein [Aliidongia dinghuensis]GGF24300.1 hypothetical protein GCM10011611_32930 [Aliidongia dinghuensis]
MPYLDTVVRPGTMTALLRGFRRCCPQCGRGALFKPGWRNILKLADACPHCGERFEGIRADDAPAYFTILVVGHIVVPLMLVAEQHDMSTPLAISLFLPLTLVLTAVLLPTIKGAIAAVMWSFGLRNQDTPTEP